MLLKSGAAMLEGAERLLTTRAALLDDPGRQLEKQYYRANEAINNSSSSVGVAREVM